MDKRDARMGLWRKGMRGGDCGKKGCRKVDKRNAGRGLWIKGMQEGDCG